MLCKAFLNFMEKEYGIDVKVLYNLRNICFYELAIGIYSFRMFFELIGV